MGIHSYLQRDLKQFLKSTFKVFRQLKLSLSPPVMGFKGWVFDQVLLVCYRFWV